MHIAGDVPQLVVFPCAGIENARDAGEGRSSDGPVSGRTIRQVLDVEDGVDDGSREAEEGRIAGKGDGKFVPEKRKVAVVVKALEHRDEDGHGETEAPDG